jgi:serine/threonine-protein kinase
MIGEQFGNYRSISLLGEGGMGAVYLAEHPGIGRRVAVKVLHKNYTRDEHLLARFLTLPEAGTWTSPIVEILTRHARRRTLFLVMELLEGESLGTWLRQNGALPIGPRRLRHQTALAPGRAHAKGSSTAISSRTTCSSFPILTTRTARSSRCSTSASRS